ncbi:MAG: hypothetical protein ACLTDX_24010 [[Clostridium] innocuum]
MSSSRRAKKELAEALGATMFLSPDDDGAGILAEGSSFISTGPWNVWD